MKTQISKILPSREVVIESIKAQVNQLPASRFQVGQTVKGMKITGKFYNHDRSSWVYEVVGCSFSQTLIEWALS